MVRSGSDTQAVDPLLQEIKSVLAATGVSRTGFGYLVAGDPGLVSKMERGRRIKKRSLREKIEAKLRELRAADGALRMLE